MARIGTSSTATGPKPMNRNFSSLWARAFAAALGIVLALMAMLLVVGALMVGLVVVCASMLWATLRGRRPVAVNLRWGSALAPRASWRPPAGDVVDVLAREVEQPPVR
jgi:uncharacterized membrane protein YgaE (UPF0421/DUF939 family)